MTWHQASPYLFGGDRFAPPAPRISRPHRRGAGWLVGLTVAASVLGLLGLIAGAGIAVRGSLGDREISDPGHRVSIRLSWTWSDLTSDDAGRTIDYGTDGTEEIPDIEAQSNVDSSYLAVQIFTHDLTGPARAHADFVDDTCKDLGCTDRGRVETVQIDGHRAYQQVLTHPSSADYPAFYSVVTTVRTTHQLTALVVEQDVDDPTGLDAARAIIATATIHD